MPFFSLYVFQAIITSQILFPIIIAWEQMPPNFPSCVILHNWFKQEWNKGIHGRAKHYKVKQYDKCTSNSINNSESHIPPSSWLEALTPERNTQQNIVTPERDTQQNNELLALLYSLNTPGLDNTYLFDSGIERICSDTGASACLSAKKENFVHLTQVNNLQILGIGRGLNVEGIGILKWSMNDDRGNEIDLFIKDALYVPSAPMGLLCPQ
jgi:hypothetical protein